MHSAIKWLEQQGDKGEPKWHDELKKQTLSMVAGLSEEASSFSHDTRYF